MGEADRVVGQLQIPEQVQLAAAPDGAIAVLVAGEIVEDRHHQLAVRVGRIGKADMVGAADTERAVGRGAAVEHQAVEIRVGGIAAELAATAVRRGQMFLLLSVPSGTRPSDAPARRTRSRSASEPAATLSR